MSLPRWPNSLGATDYSGEILDLQWDEVDELGGVVRLSPDRSKTRVGRVLPISAPIAAVLVRRQARRRAGEPRVFTRDQTTVRAWRRDAGVFEFSINQRPGRSLGGRGQVVTVEIDRANYRSFLMR